MRKCGGNIQTEYGHQYSVVQGTGSDKEEKANRTQCSSLSAS